MAEAYISGWSEGRRREVDRLLREEIESLEREVRRLKRMLEKPVYFPTIGISITAA